MKGGYLPVIIKLEAVSSDFNSIIKDLESNNIEVTEKEVGGVEESHVSQEFLLIGHVIDTDIQDTIYSISNKDSMIRSLDISLKSLKEPSSVFVEISARDLKSLDSAMSRLQKIAEKKKLTLITGIKI
jgi:ACT domain-containing protein